MSARTGDLDCPYVGLAPFEAAHAEYFFGRSIDSSVLADNVLARPIVVFYGASGVGKSSVLNVGLPRALLEREIAARVAVRREWHDPGAVLPWLDGLIVEARTTPLQPVVLVLDQFEEYFLYPSAAQVKDLARALARLAARTDIDAHLLFALRDDGLHRLDAMRRYLPQVLDTTLELRHLDERAVIEAIEQPIVVWNRHHEPPVEVETDFSRTLIAQLRPDDQEGRAFGAAWVELAYLQLALERIWEAEGGVNAAALRTSTLTERLKGIGEISRRHVEEVFGALSPEGQALCATVFDRLVTPSGGKVLYSVGDLAAVAKVTAEKIDAVLAPLASGKNRLLRSVELPGERHKRGYEILHDILARPIVDWREQRTAILERERADAARAQAEVEARLRVRAERGWTRAARWRNGFALAFILLLFAAGFSYWLAVKADRAEREAVSGQLAMHSLSELSERADLGLLLAVESWRTAEMLEARRSLLAALTRASHVHAFLETKKNSVGDLDFSADGRELLVLTASGIAIVDIATLREKGPMIQDPTSASDSLGGSLWAARFGLDGKWFAASNAAGVVTIWDRETREVRGRLRTGYPLRVRRMAVDPKGDRIAVPGCASGKFPFCSRGEVTLWDVGSLKPVGPRLTGHGDAVNAIAFAGSRLVSGSKKGDLLVWNTETGEPAKFSAVLHAEVNAVAVDPSAKLLASGGKEGLVQLWSLDKREALGAPLRGLSGAVNAVAFFPEQPILASAGKDGRIFFWDVSRGRQLMPVLTGLAGSIESLAISPTGDLLASGDVNGNVVLWDPSNRLALDQARFFTHEVSGVAAQAGYLAAGDGSGTVRLWRDGKKILEEEAPAGGEARVGLTPDGSLLAAGWCARLEASAVLPRCEAGEVVLWATGTGKRAGAFLLDGAVESLSFSRDGQKLAVGSDDGRIFVKSIQTMGDLIPPIRVHTERVNSLAFSGAGDMLVSGSYDRSVRRWSLATGQPLGGPLASAEGTVLAVAVSPNGKLLAWGGGGKQIMLWDLEAGRPFAPPLTGHTNSVFALAFSPGGDVLASASYDQSIMLWDVAGQRLLGRLDGHTAAVKAITFAEDGKQLWSGGRDGTLRSWNVDVSSWTALACRKANRNLSLSEWRRYFGETPYRKTCEGNPVHRSYPEWGTQLLDSGDMKGGREVLRAVASLEPTLSLQPDEEVRRAKMRLLVREGERFVKDGQIDRALEAYKEAVTLGSVAEISAGAWNKLCWEGSLAGFAPKVLSACENAIANAPPADSPQYHDSRGVARALTGNLEGARDDFAVFVRWTRDVGVYERYGRMREEWMAKIGQGTNPIDGATLQVLRSEGAE